MKSIRLKKNHSYSNSGKYGSGNVTKWSKGGMETINR